MSVVNNNIPSPPVPVAVITRSKMKLVDPLIKIIDKISRANTPTPIVRNSRTAALNTAAGSC